MSFEKSYYAHIEDEIAKASERLDGGPTQLTQLGKYLASKVPLGWFQTREKPRYGQMYQPLSAHDVKEIRTLEIYPGTFNEPLRGALHHCSLDFEYPEIYTSNRTSGDVHTGESFKRHTRHALSSQDGEPVFYTALSYTWGPPLFDRGFECNGATKHITRTLDSALRHFRSPTDSIMLWIDQICINQEDDDEKARQVPLMALVYRRALNTLIWLDAEPSDGAFTLLQSVQENLGEYALDEQPDSVFERFIQLDFPAEFDVQAAWRVLQGLFSRWYWLRTWIIQEAVLSSYSIVRCGHERMSWDELTTCATTAFDSGFYRWLSRQVHAEVSEIAPGCQVARDLGQQKVHVSNLGDMSMSLINALEDCRYAACTEPRDKVYGVLGLCNAGIQPDYNKPLADVYLDAAHVAMREHAREKTYQGSTTAHYHAWFRILSCVDHPPATDGRPSWVPDWSQRRQSNPLAFSSSSMVAYSAGDWHRNGIFDVSADGRALTVPGKVVGTISSLKGTICAPTLTEQPGGNIWLHDLYEGIVAMGQYANGDDAEEVLTQLCVAGKDETGKLTSPPNFRMQLAGLIRADGAHQHGPPPESHATASTNAMAKKQKKHKPPKPPRHKRSEALQNVRLACAKALTQRRFCTLSNGYLGIVPRYAQEGDTVAVFAGAAIPFIIRHVGGEMYQLIGESYVHGIMRGEVQRLGYEDTIIKLV